MRSLSRRFALALLLAGFLAAPVFAEDLPRLFMKAKQQFRLAAYAESLATLANLEKASDQPGTETYRSQLRKSLAFYRGACLAALGRTDEAVPALQEFLAYEPNASLDPSLYPPRVIAALEQARKAGPGAARAQTSRDPKAASGSQSLAASYHLFPKEISAPRVPLDEAWVDGPVQYLMTSEERLSYSRLSGPVSRSEFVTEFWRKRDPNPETPENEFRDEFERRVSFADLRMAQDETRGSLTDRGMVFVLLGPPTYIGRAPLRTGDDVADNAGMSMYTDGDLANAVKTSGRSNVVYDQMTGPSTRLPDADGNRREIWHYRREQLPVAVGFQQVDFDFITRKGYGKNVLQREERTLATLETARKDMRAGVIPKRAAK